VTQVRTTSNLPDAADLLTEDLAAEIDRRRAAEALAIERGDLCESYRLLAQTTLTALHSLTKQHERLQERHRQVIDEFRQHRARVMAADSRVGRRTAA
jgi:hypothetical protein